jgi:hypothetical protein
MSPSSNLFAHPKESHNHMDPVDIQFISLFALVRLVPNDVLDHDTPIYFRAASFHMFRDGVDTGHMRWLRYISLTRPYTSSELVQIRPSRVYQCYRRGQSGYRCDLFGSLSSYSFAHIDDTQIGLFSLTDLADCYPIGPIRRSSLFP